MSDTRITINGQRYDSPDAMPPEVRRQYEEAMRSIAPAADTTDVLTARLGPLKTNIVIHKTIRVNDKKYGSVEEMPPDVRQFVERGLEQARQASSDTSTTPGKRLSMKIGRPGIGTTLHLNSPSPGQPPPPIEPSATEENIRNFVFVLAFWVIVGLYIWTRLGC